MIADPAPTGMVMRSRNEEEPKLSRDRSWENAEKKEACDVGSRSAGTNRRNGRGEKESEIPLYPP